MRFYRPLGQISALTFDLDDTLYDNREVILRTEQESLAFVQNYHPALKAIQNKDFQKLRQSLRETEPDIYHDVTEWRRRAVEQAMLNAGLSAQDAAIGAEAAMENFAKWRSRIVVGIAGTSSTRTLRDAGTIACAAPAPKSTQSSSCARSWSPIRLISTCFIGPSGAGSDTRSSLRGKRKI